LSNIKHDQQSSKNMVTNHETHGRQLSKNMVRNRQTHGHT
jgi:hypothetical protein